MDDAVGGRDGRVVASVTTSPTAPVGDFAQTAASHPGGTATASQTGTFRFGTVVTTATGGGGGGETPKPASPVKTGITAIETLLHNLLPASPSLASWTEPGPVHRDWATVVCFSCGKPGHGATRCPALNKAFPCMLPGWKADKVGCGYAMISPSRGSRASPG